MNLLKRVVRLAVRVWQLGWAQGQDLLACTYSLECPAPQPLLQSLETPAGVQVLDQDVARLFERNHFDLLGSGWRDWTRSGRPNRVNLGNRRHASRIASLVDGDHAPVDWHLDPRTGYRWQAAVWSRWIRPARPAGVDIKMPWEMSRAQHLLPLALSAMGGDRQQLVRKARAFRNQVLDFIATNPPRFGVNWRTPMDVAIRAANWAVTFSIYRSAGHGFDEAFEKVLGASLLDHGRHVVAYMEWDPEWRANHYLANQCGLAIIAASLPRTPETRAWLAFAVQEMNTECLRQIQPDGSVFEASTGYHRLSLEMLVYATAVVLGVIARGGEDVFLHYDAATVHFPKPLNPAPMTMHPLPGHPQRRVPFPSAYFERLTAAAFFARDIGMADGLVPLIGDNDSGRFIRTRVVAHRIGWDQVRRRYANLADSPPVSWLDACPQEEQRDFRYLTGLVAGLVHNPTFEEWSVPWQLEQRLVAALSGGLAAEVSNPQRVTRLDLAHPGALPRDAKTLRISLPRDATADVRCLAYPDFGLYLMRGRRLFVALRCGQIGQGGFGGHDHNDQLEVLLQVDGRNLIGDPGVYRYTVDEQERRQYRSVHAHFCPSVGEREPGDLDLGPWRLGDQAQAEVEYFEVRCFQGSHAGFGSRVHRRVQLADDHLLISDWADGGLEVQSPAELFKRLNGDGCLVPLCPGYGVQHA